MYNWLFKTISANFVRDTAKFLQKIIDREKKFYFSGSVNVN